MKKKKNHIGPVTTIIFLTIIVALIGTFFSLIGVDGTVTSMTNNALETSLVNVESILTFEGIRYLFSNIVTNFVLCEPLVLLIIALIGVSICEQSGLLKAKMESIKKYKPSVITFVVLLIGFVSAFLGSYGYVIFLPLVGIMYKYLGRNGMLGVITLFLGVTIGHACGFMYNYDSHLLGIITQNSASLSVDKNYIFDLSSNIYIMIASSIIFIFGLTIIITNYLEYKFAKPEKYEDSTIVSKRGLKSTNIALLFMSVILIFLLIPGIGPSGILLDLEQNTYIAKLFSDSAPFKDGVLFLIVIMMMICGLVYGKTSGNIKNSDQYNQGLSRSFSKAGYVFVLLFFSSILISVLNYTHLGEVICANLVEFIGGMNFTGVFLILALFVITIMITILMPSILGKWVLMAPVVIPLFMKANISPSFTQFIFGAADSVGKCFTPFFAYFIVMIGFMEKHNDTNSKVNILGTIKIMGRTIILIAVIWMLIIIGWYIIGLPTGVGTYPTL